MAGFRSFVEVAAAHEAGRVRYAGWRKTITQTTITAVWFDLSMTPGNPVPQYYAAAPLVGTILRRSTDGGLDHGQDVTTSKHLRRLTVMMSNTIANNMHMMDYLMFYPFIEQGTLDAQVMSNPVPLSRYADGDGVQIMVVSVGAGVGSQTFQVTYTNQDGVSGRTTGVARLNAAAYVGAVASSSPSAPATLHVAPFLTLQNGDTGVRSIESFTMVSGTDVGLLSLVLVKPLATLSFANVSLPHEVDFIQTRGGTLPRIENDAYLNFVICPNNAMTGIALIGDITTIWS